MDRSVLDRASRYVAKLPPAVSGEGGHDRTFHAACVLVHGFNLGEPEALAVLREWNASCNPPWSEAELRHKISSAAKAPCSRPRGYLVGTSSQPRLLGHSKPAPVFALPQRKPVFEPETLERIAAGLPCVNEQFIKDRSPLCPETQTPASFLQRLYRPGECVIIFDVFQSQGRHVCQCVEPPYDAGCLNHLVNGCRDGVWFLCNPVDGAFHPNPRMNGKQSRRSEESVTAWRYLVLESDQADTRLWLAALVQMPLRISAIYTSGGRSIHALVRLDARSKQDWDAKARKLKPMLTVLGADPAAITAVRLTRLPGCHRGQDGPPPPAKLVARRRLVDEPLRFDQRGDPIWTPGSLSAESPSDRWQGGKLQELLYLDPEPNGEPIQFKPTRLQLYQDWLAKFETRPGTKGDSCR
jgi:hypothetical protein